MTKKLNQEELSKVAGGSNDSYNPLKDIYMLPYALDEFCSCASDDDNYYLIKMLIDSLEVNYMHNLIENVKDDLKMIKLKFNDLFISHPEIKDNVNNYIFPMIDTILNSLQ